MSNAAAPAPSSPASAPTATSTAPAAPWDHVPPWTANTDLFGDTRATKEETRAGVLVDASGVVRVKPAGVRHPESAGDVRAALAEARAAGQQVTIAGTRHSGGGQSLQDGALLLDMRGMDGLRYDAATGALDVQPGATWEQVQRYLDPLGRSIAVQQSSNVFSVGGAIATNVHGRDVRFGPLVDTVESVKVLLASGEEVTASRTERPDLFAATVGGYGQTGVVTEARLQTVPNEQLVRSMTPVKRSEVGAFMRSVAADPDSRSLQVRLPTYRSNLFGDGYALQFRATAPGTPVTPMKPRGSEGVVGGVSKAVFGAAVRTDLGKRALWEITTRGEGLLGPGTASRNQVMAPPTEFLRSGSTEHRQILQEYFIPVDRIDSFLGELEGVVREHDANVINLTLRWTPAERRSSTALPYATGDRIGAVLYLDQLPGDREQARMDEFVRAATDLAVEAGGAPYLPYQLGAFTQRQLDAAYPTRAAFADTVRRWDPENLFGGAIEAVQPAPGAGA